MLKIIVNYGRYVSLICGASGTAMILSKLLGIISFSWWIVLSPYLLCFTLIGLFCAYMFKLSDVDRENLIAKMHKLKKEK